MYIGKDNPDQGPSMGFKPTHLTWIPDRLAAKNAVILPTTIKSRLLYEAAREA